MPLLRTSNPRPQSITRLQILSSSAAVEPGFCASALAMEPITQATPQQVHTTRISTESVSNSSAPSVSIKDLEVDPASNYPAKPPASAPPPKRLASHLGIGYGTPPLTAETGSFSTTLNGDVLPFTVLLGSKGYRAELGQVFVNYTGILTCSGGAFTLSGSGVDLPKGFFLQADAGDYSLSLTESLLARALQLVSQTESFSLSGLSAALPKGTSRHQQRDRSPLSAQTQALRSQPV